MRLDRARTSRPAPPRCRRPPAGRLRTADGSVEVHVIEFATPGGLAAYRADPRRAEQAPLLEQSGAQVELLEVEDIPTA